MGKAGRGAFRDLWKGTLGVGLGGRSRVDDRSGGRTPLRPGARSRGAHDAVRHPAAERGWAGGGAPHGGRRRPAECGDDPRFIERVREGLTPTMRPRTGSDFLSRSRLVARPSTLRPFHSP